MVILDTIVLVLALILNPRANRRRRREAEAQLADAENGEGGVSAPGVTGKEQPDEHAIAAAQAEKERTAGFHLHSTAPDEADARREGLGGAQSASPHHGRVAEAREGEVEGDEERTLAEQ